MDTIQLHGDEPPEMGHYFVRKGYRVIKAFGIEEAGDFQRTLPYESACQLFCSIPGADSLEGPGNRSTGIY